MIKKLAGIAVACVILAGCSTQTFVMSSTSATTPKTDKMQSFFISGIGQSATVSAAKICGGANHVAKVQVQQSFVNVLLNAVTFGIYSPRQARVFCTK